MKKFLLFLFPLSFLGSYAQNQNVGIGTTTPDASSILDLKASDKGFLAPMCQKIFTQHELFHHPKRY